MRKLCQKELFGCVLAGGLLVSQSYGAVVNEKWTVGGGGAEVNLWEILEGSFVDNTYTQLPGDGLNGTHKNGLQTIKDTWSTAEGSQLAALVVEHAGHANANRFGVYEINLDGTAGRTLEIFPGTASAPASDTLLISTSGGVNPVWTLSLENQPSQTMSLAANNTQFGFYLQYENTFFYSNPTHNDDGNDYLATYDINKTRFGRGQDGLVLAWEDVTFASSDKDYNDMVITLTAQPVPEPTTMIAGALLLLPFAGSTLRFIRRNRKA